MSAPSRLSEVTVIQPTSHLKNFTSEVDVGDISIQ